MEIKIKLDKSFFTGLVAGIILSLILVSSSLGIMLVGMHFKSSSRPYPYDAFEPKAEEASQPSAPKAAAETPTQGPTSAPIKLVEFSDFHCHFCHIVSGTIKQLMAKYPGKIYREYRHYPLQETPGQGSFLTHEWAECAQAQNKFWPFHDEVFALPKGPTPDDLKAIAGKIGLDQAKLDQCVKSGRYVDYIKQDRALGGQKGVTGTPMFLINDQKVAGAYPLEHFVSVVEGILKPGSQPPAPQAAAPAAPPAPPAVVTFNDLAGRPSKGPANAKVTIVQFSDFHCPFCSRVEPTMDQIEKAHPGQVRIVWRHFPLDMHAGAKRTHEASECAFEQGKFWEYHGKLFQTQSGARDDQALAEIAKQVGLDAAKFDDCMKSGRKKAMVESDIQKGAQSGVNGTPASFVNGELVSGAVPFESFDAIVKKKLG